MLGDLPEVSNLSWLLLRLNWFIAAGSPHSLTKTTIWDSLQTSWRVDMGAQPSFWMLCSQNQCPHTCQWINKHQLHWCWYAQEYQIEDGDTITCGISRNFQPQNMNITNARQCRHKFTVFQKRLMCNFRSDQWLLSHLTILLPLVSPNNLS